MFGWRRGRALRVNVAIAVVPWSPNNAEGETAGHGHRRPVVAAKGSGPKFHKGGRTPLYATADLDEWARETIGPAVLSNMEHRLMSGMRG